MSESLPTKIIGSVFVPPLWNALCDANGRTVCVLVVAPVFRVLAGNPMDPRICACKVSMTALANYAKVRMYNDALNGWDHTRAIRQ